MCNASSLLNLSHPRPNDGTGPEMIWHFLESFNAKISSLKSIFKCISSTIWKLSPESSWHLYFNNLADALIESEFIHFHTFFVLVPRGNRTHNPWRYKLHALPTESHAVIQSVIELVFSPQCLIMPTSSNLDSMGPGTMRHSRSPP